MSISSYISKNSLKYNFLINDFFKVLDGSEDAERRAYKMLNWDVSNGVARRAWSGNSNAQNTIKRAMEEDGKLKVTLANRVENRSIIDNLKFN